MRDSLERLADSNNALQSIGVGPVRGGSRISLIRDFQHRLSVNASILLSLSQPSLGNRKVEQCLAESCDR
jgi:hypothetical protein